MPNNVVPLFLTDKEHEPLLAHAVDGARLKKAKRLSRIEKMLDRHKWNKRLILAFLTIVLILLFVAELTYSLGREEAWQLTLLK